MPIADNYEALTTYDSGQQIQTQKLNISNERAGQVVAFEMLRHLKALFEDDTVSYNNMTNEEWEAAKTAVLSNAKHHPNARVKQLDTNELEAAFNLGGNYFEHGYSAIMDGTSQQDKIGFTYYG